MTELCLLPAYQLRDKLLAKTLSAEELLEIHIQRIHKINPAINALVTLDLAGAEQQAKTADHHLAKTGEGLGPLHGLPLAVKDTFAVKGVRTTFGNTLYQDHIPVADDHIVSQEKSAGAVVVGKSNTPDFGSGGITQNAIFGTTKNPWDLNKTTSGSSGGGAAAVASGLVAIANGSDVGGSLRTPAAWCGCTGIRPSRGRIPQSIGQNSDGHFSIGGAMARCAADIALHLEAVEGPNPNGTVLFYSGPQATRFNLINNTPEGTIGWAWEFADSEFQGNLHSCYQTAREAFKDLPLQIENCALPIGTEFRTLHPKVNAYAMANGLPDQVIEHHQKGGETKPSIAATLDLYSSLSPWDWRNVWREVNALKVRMNLLFQQYRFIVHPTHFGQAFGIDDAIMERNFDWATLYLAPMLGLPSISVPAGIGDDGMPFGIMLTAQTGDDMALLQLAHTFQQHTAFHLQRPTAI